MKSNLFDRLMRLVLLVLVSLVSMNAKAQRFSTIEVGEATLPAFTTASATTLTPFTRITFDAAFASGVIPNVFPMTPEFGAGADDDPCLIRIRNVDNTGFDAVCFESRDEDRNSPGTTFEYIAIVPGTTDIPTTSGGNVRFESQCVFLNRQTSPAPNCNNCDTSSGIAVGNQRVNFVNTFNNIPALLTHLTTTNNTLSGSSTTPGGEPEFLESATTSLDITGFNAGIDRLEAGNGVLNNGETMCYLAVERSGCQTLDLTGLNDNIASVNFDAVFGENVDGHDNGATSGEGASFSDQCFTSTPVGVADMRTRRGNNGGFVRRASINANEIILTIDEDRTSNSERSHIDEMVSVLAFSQTFTTPVTLSRVRVNQLGRNLRVDWQTSAESLHLGFHLWGEVNDGWVQLNRKIIPGKGMNTDSKSEYSHRLRLTREQFNQIQRFGISSVDTTGYEEFYGPFEAGQEYGAESTTEAIDWSATRAMFERRMQANGFVKVRGKWRKHSSRLQRRLERREARLRSNTVELTFDGVGVRKVPVKALLSVFPHWSGRPLSSLAVTLNDQSVARHLVSHDRRLSSDDVLFLNVVSPQGQDALYIDRNRYRIVLDSSKALDAPIFDGRDVEGKNLVSYAFNEVVLTEDKRYSAAITSGDPWYDAELFAINNAVEVNYMADIDVPMLEKQAGELEVSIFGSIDLPDPVDDHHVLIKVNGEVVGDIRFDGLTEYRTAINLRPGLLVEGQNRVAVSVPGDTGLLADLVLVDRLVLKVPTHLNSQNAVDFEAQPHVQGYNLVSPHSLGAPKTVFAHSQTGGFVVINSVEDDTGHRFSAMPFSQSENNPDVLRYSIVDTETVSVMASVEAVTTQVLHETAANLLIVAHPNFISDALNEYAEFKRSEGYSVQIVSWLDLVESYGFGNNTPNALNRFLQRAKEVSQIENVLIVGGHTYDYLDTLGTGVVNFIPTHYRRVGIFEFAPTDNVFADLDGDNLPELAVGRWPVRSQQDLITIINKSKAWQQKRQSTNQQAALLIAQPDDGRNLRFDESLEGRVTAPLRALAQFGDPTRVYLQDLQTDGFSSPVQRARAMISEAINSGTDLVSFAGHASTSGWGFQGVVNTQLIKNLENHNNPTMVMPLACYTTNYQSLSVNTLAHQWLFAGSQGAVAVHGAAMLGEYRENGIFAERFLNKSQEFNTLGTAIREAKRQMTGVNQMLHNWALLGDPTLLLN